MKIRSLYCLTHSLFRCLVIAFLALAGSSIAVTTPVLAQETDAQNIETLANNQNPDGSWSGDDPMDDKLIITSRSVSSLINYAVDPDAGLGLPSPFEVGFEYADNIELGLAYILKEGGLAPITQQLAGDPDQDGSGDPDVIGNGLGICFNCGKTNETETTSLVLVTMCQTVEFKRKFEAGPSYDLNGLTYEEISRDIIDYLSFGQNDASSSERGSWGLMANIDPGFLAGGEQTDEIDPGPTGAASLALLQYAENEAPRGCGLNVPRFVKDELDTWYASQEFDTSEDPFKISYKECPRGWKEGIGRKGLPEGEDYPLCFQLTEDFTYDLTLTFSNPFNLPCFPSDPRFLTVNWCSDPVSIGIALLHIIDVMPSAEKMMIDMTEKPRKMYFSLERDDSGGGILKIRKGYRWDGPTPPGTMKKPADYRENFMVASLVHDALYDLMREGEEHGLKRDTFFPTFLKGFWNQAVADNSLFFLLQKKISRARAAGFWWGIRFWGRQSTKKAHAIWKTHALADAGPDQVHSCAPPGGVPVTFDGSKSEHTDLWEWRWRDGDAPLIAAVDTPTIVQTLPLGRNVILLTAKCKDGVTDNCEEKNWDEDVVEILIEQDNRPPVVTYPEGITELVPPDRVGAAVSFDVAAIDNCSAAKVSCSPESGDSFRMGTTPVRCDATDDAGNTKSVDFDVTVKVDDTIQWRTEKARSGSISWLTLFVLSSLAVLRFVLSGFRESMRQFTWIDLTAIK